ncbi:MAG: hypothetical protein ABSB95_00205 [Dissulfurispiraceae bacterium]
MKQIRIFVMVVALSFILPFAVCAQEHRHSHRGEIRIVNDTESQVSIYVTTEKYGRIGVFTFKPGQNSYLLYGEGNLKLRVSGNDEIEIADWGKTYIGDVAEFVDGVWNLSIRHAHHEMHHR